MFVVDLIKWWYFRGWTAFISQLKTSLGNSVDFFSLGQLLRTLFMPYRQISANASKESSGSAIGAFFDRLISRLIGAITRIFILIFGVIVIVLEAIIGSIVMIIWPAIPFLPVAGVILSFMGVAL